MEEKTKTVLEVLKVGVVFDMLSTYIFLTYTALAEGNNLVSALYYVHPLAILAYVPLVYYAAYYFMKIMVGFKMEIEGRAAVVILIVLFFEAFLSNIFLVMVEVGGW